MERPSSFVHFASVIEQPDMCQDGAQTVVSMRQIVLQRERAFEVGNRFHMLEVFRWSPEQKSAGHVSFGQVRV